MEDQKKRKPNVIIFLVITILSLIGFIIILFGIQIRTRQEYFDSIPIGNPVLDSVVITDIVTVFFLALLFLIIFFMSVIPLIMALRNN